MKKRIFAIVMAVIMVTTLVLGAIPAMAAEGGVTIRIHYHRPDGDYEGWEIWAWDEDGNYDISGTLASDGTASIAPPFKLEQGDNEVVCTLNVPTGTMKVGYIVRKGDWVEKDVEHDQFINITGILSGTVDFYVESGVASQPSKEAVPTMEDLCAKTIEYNGKTQAILVPNEDCVYGIVVTGAEYAVDNKGRPHLKVQLSKASSEITAESFVITGAGDIVAANITEVMSVGAAYYVFLDQELALDSAYNITFEDNQYAIKLPDYYSTKEFEEKYTYDGDDLGATYTKEKTTLKVWAPLAQSVTVRLFKNGDPAKQENPDKEVAMVAPDKETGKGVWSVELEGDMNGTYYTYWVDNISEQKECVDPYSRTTGVNGRRTMIIDLASTNPDGWANDKDPHYDDAITDAVIWELHVRDLSIDPSSGVKEEWRGKYLGLTQAGTTNTHGQATGLDYIKNLGITHIHLLPVYDFGSVDETKNTGFNWGYDPMNYNVPEGSYSTDPYNGEVRVKEFKQMVKTLHDNGISVIMDVVYNHVYDSAKFCMNNTVPDYFSRPNSNGSGCGNDTASERSMVSKYIVDSVNYWADEYHIDGFRFDLVGLIDTNTINNIVKTVQAKHPNVIFYGEGWTMGTVTTKPGVTLATQTNSGKTPNFAYFSDTIRNDLKGGTYNGVTAGYISGGGVGSLDACFKGMPSWCSTPTQSVNYISCHDNNTLFDHISMVKKGAQYEDITDITKLGVAFYMAAQGIPFMQAGEEMNRSKPDANAEGGFNENSYNAPDSVNSIKWDLMYDQTTVDLIEYYKGMIAFRKAHPVLRLTNASDVNTRVSTLTGLSDKVLGYQIDAAGVEGETAESIICVYNPNADKTTVSLPEGDWYVCVNKAEAGIYALSKVSGSVDVESVSAMILVKGNVQAKPGVDLNAAEASTNWIVVACIWAAVAALSAGGAILLLKKKN